jgi:hypothetical protein
LEAQQGHQLVEGAEVASKHVSGGRHRLFLRFPLLGGGLVADFFRTKRGEKAQREAHVLWITSCAT